MVVVIEVRCVVFERNTNFIIIEEVKIDIISNSVKTDYEEESLS